MRFSLCTTRRALPLAAPSSNTLTRPRATASTAGSKPTKCSSSKPNFAPHPASAAPAYRPSTSAADSLGVGASRTLRRLGVGRGRRHRRSSLAHDADLTGRPSTQSLSCDCDTLVVLPMPRKRTPGWRAGVLAGCLAGASIHTVAWIAPPANQNLALQKFEQGRGEFQANRYAEALASFQASLELEPSPNSRLYIARCYRALGKVGSAYTTYRLAASEAEDRVRATGEARYGATRDTAAKEADEIQTKVPSLALIVPPDMPADFSLTVDGSALNRAAWSSRLTVDPGAHVVKATGARLRAFEVSVTVAEGEKKDVAIQAAHLPTASLQISWQTKPSVFAVSIDGKSVDTDSLEKPRDVDVGEHTIVVSSPGYKSFNWTKRLADGDTANVTVALTPDVQSGPVQVSAGG